MSQGRKIIAVLTCYLLLAFPLFYFVYKYSSPYIGMIDFFDYYKLYAGMDYKAADSPLNMRLLSSFFVYILNKSGFYYDTLTQIDNSPFEKSIYFNAIFLNYIWVCLTCVIIFFLARKRSHSVLLSFSIGLLYLLGFGTIFYELMPLADALGVLIFGVFLWFYHEKRQLVVIPIALLVIQREYLLLAIGLISFLDLLRFREKYYAYTLIYSVIFFVLYVILRKVFFETPRYSHHTDVGFMLGSFSKLHFPLLPFFRQTLMTMNVTVIYFLIILYKWYNKIHFEKFDLQKVLLLLVQAVVLAFLLALGNNTGRYFYMLLPLILLYIADEVKPILELDK